MRSTTASSSSSICATRLPTTPAAAMAATLFRAASDPDVLAGVAGRAVAVVGAQRRRARLASRSWATTCADVPVQPRRSSRTRTMRGARRRRTREARGRGLQPAAAGAGQRAAAAVRRGDAPDRARAGCGATAGSSACLVDDELAARARARGERLGGGLGHVGEQQAVRWSTTARACRRSSKPSRSSVGTPNARMRPSGSITRSALRVAEDDALAGEGDGCRRRAPVPAVARAAS